MKEQKHYIRYFNISNINIVCHMFDKPTIAKGLATIFIVIGHIDTNKIAHNVCNYNHYVLFISIIYHYPIFYAVTGSCTWNSVPSPTVLFTLICPSIPSTMDLESARPIPTLFGLTSLDTRQNLLKIFGSSDSGIPIP